MKFMDKVWGSLGIFESVEVEEEPKTKGEELEPVKGKKGNSNVVNLPTAQKQMRVMVVEPFSFDDAQHIADHLKNRKPVVVNFENCDKEVADDCCTGSNTYCPPKIYKTCCWGNRD